MRVEEDEFLLAVRQIVRIVDVDTMRPGTCGKLAQNISIIPIVMRASARQDARLAV